jgi:hypothetical protein
MLAKAPDAPLKEETRLLSRRAIRILARIMRLLAVGAALIAALTAIRYVITVLEGGASTAALTWLRTRFLSASAVGTAAGVLGVLTPFIIRALDRRRTQRIDEEIKASAERIRPGPTTTSDEVEAVKAAVMESEPPSKVGPARPATGWNDSSPTTRCSASKPNPRSLSSFPACRVTPNDCSITCGCCWLWPRSAGCWVVHPHWRPAHLGKWIVLLERWPELSWPVRADPALMDHLEQAVTNGVNPQAVAGLQAIVRTVAPQVAVTSDLAAFLADEQTLAPLVERLIYCSRAAATATA